MLVGTYNTLSFNNILYSQSEHGDITTLIGLIYLKSILGLDNHELLPECRGNVPDTKLLNVIYLSNWKGYMMNVKGPWLPGPPVVWSLYDIHVPEELAILIQLQVGLSEIDFNTSLA